MLSKTPTPNIVFIGLNMGMNVGPTEYQCRKVFFKAKTGIEKIKLLAEEIERICSNLKTKEDSGEIPRNAMWIMGWQEYGITELEQQIIVSTKTRNMLKEKMNALTSKYSNLTIIAGTIATKKEITPKSVDFFDKVVGPKYHAAAGGSDLKQSRDYLVFDMQRERFLNHELDKLTVVRNSCFVFQKGKNIWTRSKTSPWFELGMNKDPDLMFHPGRVTNMVKELQHPDPQVQHTVPLAIEICAEHSRGILKGSDPKNIMIHCVMSAAAPWKHQHYCGDYGVHLDSGRGATLMEGSQSSQFTFIPVNFFEELAKRGELAAAPAAPNVTGLQSMSLFKQPDGRSASIPDTPTAAVDDKNSLSKGPQ